MVVIVGILISIIPYISVPFHHWMSDVGVLYATGALQPVLVHIPLKHCVPLFA
jgi:hypothetical protein